MTNFNPMFKKAAKKAASDRSASPLPPIFDEGKKVVVEFLKAAVKTGAIERYRITEKSGFDYEHGARFVLDGILSAKRYALRDRRSEGDFVIHLHVTPDAKLVIQFKGIGTIPALKASGVQSVEHVYSNLSCDDAQIYFGELAEVLFCSHEGFKKALQSLESKFAPRAG